MLSVVGRAFGYRIIHEVNVGPAFALKQSLECFSSEKAKLSGFFLQAKCQQAPDYWQTLVPQSLLENCM